MDEYITIGQGLTITVFSMVIVFIVLVIISYLIDLLSALANRGESIKELNIVESNIVEKGKNIKEPMVDENIDDEELVAVISAAIAASLGVAIPEINIKSIKRTSSSKNSWSEMGKVEQISGKL